MTLNISSVFTYDEDAGNYIQAVEAADEADTPGIGALEPATRQAINNFVVGCKQDGIWDAIKASCILAGARTLNGALQPLVGTAPNKFGTEGNWNYNRKTGLQGDGSTNYLNSNRNNNADPQDNNHNAFYRTATGGVAAQVMFTAFASGENTFYDNNTGSYNIRNRSITPINFIGTSVAGFAGVSRAINTQFSLRSNTTTTIHSLTSQVPSVLPIGIFGTSSFINNPGRIAFYSIGESLDLALLDGRVTDLINKFAEVIP